MKQNNIIGVIGGMGPQASAEFYRLLIDGARHSYGARNNDEFPEVLIDSVPVPDFISDTEKMEIAALMLEDRVRRLSTYGVSLITMACNTANILSKRLQDQTSVPYISIIDEVVQRVAEAKRSVMLFASPTLLRLGLYQSKFKRRGVRCEVPRPSDYLNIENIIRGVIENEDEPMLTERFVRLVNQYVDTVHVDAIVLGCTELPLVFPKQYRLPAYSSLSVLAESILKRYYTKEEP